MRKKLNKLNDILSWIVLFATFALLIFTLFTVSSAAKTGEGAFLFGYRPVLVLTGSMEPYMMTNSICLTEKVDDINEIEVGDVITFHVNNEKGDKITITHRVVSIDDGYINTKGDNNYVTDDLMLTIDNVEAKVVCVFNQTAWLAAKWKTTSGKVMICSFVAALFLGYFALKLFFAKDETEEETMKEAEETPSFEVVTVPIGEADSAPESTAGPDEVKASEGE